MENKYCLIGPFTQLISLEGLPPKGALKDDDLQLIFQAGLLMKGEKIHAVGTFQTLQEEAAQLGASVVVLEGDYVCLPGFVDAHTHICFSGSRARDYAMRNAGQTYLDISRAGGGIWDTVTQTRKISLEELASFTSQRAAQHLREGVTTIEVKSGYGLSVSEELKMLRAIKLADQSCAADLVPTCLAAHILPKDYPGDALSYLREISEKLFPVLLEEQLTKRIDAFIEESAFSEDEISAYFTEAKRYGFDITVHADQFSVGGSSVAINFNALSADHLEAITEEQIALMAKSETIAVALPGASIGLGCPFAPARKLLDAGISLAVASDWNPGSAPMGDLLCQAAILGAFEKLSAAEVLSGITFRAASALGLSDRGRLAPGCLADFNLFPTDNYQEILYHQGKLKPAQVWKKGTCMHSTL